MSSLKALYKILFISGLLILTNCSVEKNTGTTRLYHGMTARFNIYFNGYESFKSGLAKLSTGYRDDYAEMLRVFEYSDPSSVSLVSSDMEAAIQKASKLITLKSITAKPEVKDKRQPDDVDRELLERKEYNEWVDDSYLLIGKARFYKHEFTEAASVFNYSITGANDPEISKESSIWLARINNETGNFSTSLRLLNELDVTSDFPKSLQAMYNTTLADLYVKQKRYPEAIEPLEKALELVSGKRTKYRLTYLLAQLYENTGNGAKATSLYRKVVKMNPPYDVEFNARINTADVFDINSGNPKEIRKELEKMLRDSKNKDFQDQIYFALGNMFMKEGDEAGALDYFHKSASSPSLNPNQKGRAYLALANHFYLKKDYMRAGTYYDSTVYFLDQKHPDYQKLRTTSQNLNALVAQLTVIQREDSLQRVAAMPEQQRNALIAEIISTAAKDELAGNTNENSDRYNIGQYYENERRFQGNIQQEGKWYFYNQAALTFGRTEFRRRWGERRFEDNWRRSNKATVNTQSEDDTGGNQQIGGDTNKAVIDRTKPEFYLQNLPLNDSALAVSNDKLALALLDAGKAYSERLADTISATEILDKLISRYPESPLLAEALYDLYNINKGRTSIKAEAYRQRLLERFPTSEFGRILSDPAYHQKKMADLKLSENLYEDAYNKYTSGKYSDAISVTDDALQKYPQNLLAPKFLLLRAYSIAAVTDERKFRDELTTVIKSWPGTPESKKAEELISYLNEKVPELKVEEDTKIAAELYITSDTLSTHIFALIIEDPAFNINLATFDVISYNIDNYTNNNLRTEGTLVDNKYIMINVSGFRNYSAAMDYYRNFNPGEVIRNSTGKQIMSFIINDENSKVLSNDKNPDRYRIFFIENYIKRK